LSSVCPTATRVLSREIDIRAGETAVTAGGQLVATGDARLALKGDEPRRARPIDESSTPPAHGGEVQVVAGGSRSVRRSMILSA